MAVAQTGVYEAEIGGARRRLLLRNGEIERFETQYAPFGLFELFDQFFIPGQPKPSVRHVRDLVALGLIGGGMSDRSADELIASLPPAENMALFLICKRLLGFTFMPAVTEGDRRKKRRGSATAAAGVSASPDTTPADASPTSSA